jgi:chromosome segregation ATPase
MASTSQAQSCADPANRYQMIDSIEINNFRCFKKLRIKDCAPINVIVGENGAGKTALLEAVFLTLCGNPQKAALLRQMRGSDPLFQGDPKSIVEAIYAEFFYRLDMNCQPTIHLRGSGPEVRSLTITRGRGDVRIPKGAKSADVSYRL